MKKIVALTALLGATVAPTAFAATPEVFITDVAAPIVVDNPACQEVIFTYTVDLFGTEGPVTVDGAELSVKNTADNAVYESGKKAEAKVANVGAANTALADVPSPCAPETRYEIYSDDFHVAKGETEDLTVKVFFTPETDGEFYATLGGIDLKDANTSGGGGKCRNCVVIDEEEEFLGVEFEDNSDQIIEILAFISQLISLGLITLE